MNSIENKPTKPKLRGHFHQAAFFAALGAGSMLIGRLSSSSTYTISTWVYVLTLCFMYGISTLYHRPNWTPKLRQWFRKLDHTAIYLLIAGTATPLATSTLDQSSRNTFLVLMWGSAVIGFFQSLFWIKAPKALSALFYLVMGSLALPYLSKMGLSLGTEKLILLLIGTLAYALGAIVYAIKFPNPLPKSFGYHEVFHLLVIAGSFCHFILIQHIVLSA